MEDIKGSDDVLNQRLKNRERQRRYRARKRLEADTTNAETIIQAQDFIHAQEAQREKVQKQLSQALASDTSRIYCKRKWKKDARVAYMSKQRASGSSNSANSPAGSSHESEALQLLLNLRGESLSGSGLHCNNTSSQGETGTKTSAPIRRKWKVEARNKTK